MAFANKMRNAEQSGDERRIERAPNYWSDLMLRHFYVNRKDCMSLDSTDYQSTFETRAAEDGSEKASFSRRNRCASRALPPFLSISSEEQQAPDDAGFMSRCKRHRVRTHH